MKYNLEYLNSLIENGVEENLNLDYKAAAALNKQNNKTTEISKDISALANSDGGIIIYGIKESNVTKHLPESIDPINRQEFSKEWLEQIIQDKIRPRISEFKIHPIDISKDLVTSTLFSIIPSLIMILKKTEKSQCTTRCIKT